MEASVPCAAFRREKSQNGVNLSVLKSGLQKYIRRGETEKALWCMGELLSFRNAPEAGQIPRILTNIRHRLMVIFLEDVGDIGLWPQADGFLGQGDDAAVHGWVVMMSVAQKSRMCSHARSVAVLGNGDNPAHARLCRLYPSIETHCSNFRLHPQYDNEIAWGATLEYALRHRDPLACLWAWRMHTRGNMRKATGGRKPALQILDVLERAVRPDIREHIDIARRWYKELSNMSESFLCWMLPLLAHLFDYPNVAPPVANAPAFTFEAQGPMEIDSYVLDMHVPPAHRASREVEPVQGWKVIFAEEGSLVANESPLVDPVWKEFYNDCKRVESGQQPLGPPHSSTAPVSPLSDSDFCEVMDDILSAFQDVDIGANADGAPTRESEYRFLVRAQINTSQNKTDVYFAHDPRGRLVVVKGPFASREPVDRAVQMARWKTANGIPAITCWGAELVPDRWPEGIPLGVRNRITRSLPAWFLLSESLVSEADLVHRRRHQSRLWPSTEVVDWGAPDLTRTHVWAPLTNWETYSDREKDDYVTALLARYVIGISDLADRNFMRSGGRLYAFDEDSRVPSTGCVRIPQELRKGKTQIVRRWIHERYEKFAVAVAAWQVPEDAERRWHNARDRLRQLSYLVSVSEKDWPELYDDLPY